MSLVAVDGGALRRDTTIRCDVVVVGSGPGGATVARDLAAAGADVVVVEAGRWVQPHEFSADPLVALASLYEGSGFTLTKGRSPMQLLYGRALGGTSVVNSAICWRLPKTIHDEWLVRDPALGEALPFEAIERAGSQIEGFLSVAPTDAAIAGINNTLMARGADSLGWSHRPTRRNTRGCEGLGRCNGGCPNGAKLSMDRSMLPAAAQLGARIVTSVRIDEIVCDGDAARAVAGTAAGGARLRVEAQDAVVLAGGAVGTPLLLWGSGLRHGPVGLHLQCHPGVTVAGRFAEEVSAWNGATQGHEVTEHMDSGIKLESLALRPQVLATRLEVIGENLVAEMGRLAYWASWAAGIRTRAQGKVRPSRAGRPRVHFELQADDVRLVNKAISALGTLLFAAGALEIAPSVAGLPARITDPNTIKDLEADGPSDPRAFTLGISHMFGTCRMGSNPNTSVVRPDFRHHRVKRLYLADASVFPSNLGVNPQISIMSMASVCASQITDPHCLD